jgi:hypothetical protein
MGNLAQAYVVAGKPQLAIPLYEELLPLRRAKSGDDHSDVLVSMGNLAVAYTDAGMIEQSLAQLEDLLRIKRTKYGDAHAETLAEVLHLASRYLRANHDSRGRQLIEEFVERNRQAAGPETPEFGKTLAVVSHQLLKARQFSTAELYLRECLTVWRRTQPEDWSTYYAQLRLGESLLGQENYSEAQPALLGGYEGIMKRKDLLPTAAKVRLAEVLQQIVDLYTLREKPIEAQRWRAKLQEVQSTIAEEK